MPFKFILDSFSRTIEILNKAVLFLISSVLNLALSFNTFSQNTFSKFSKYDRATMLSKIKLSFFPSLNIILFDFNFSMLNESSKLLVYVISIFLIYSFGKLNIVLYIQLVSSQEKREFK